MEITLLITLKFIDKQPRSSKHNGKRTFQNFKIDSDTAFYLGLVWLD